MLKNTINKLTEADKRQHIIYSVMIILISLYFLAILPSLIFTFTIGVLKEIWDEKYGSGFCWFDMLANCVGILIGVVLFLIISQS